MAAVAPLAASSNRARLERFFAAFHAGDRATVAALIHPEMRLTEAAGLPYGGVYRGLAGWDQLIARIDATWRDVAITPQYILGEDHGDRFAAMHRFAGVSRRTGRAFAMPVFELWGFHDALIVEIQPFYFDTWQLAELDQHPVPAPA